MQRLSHEGSARIAELVKDPLLLELRHPVAVLAYLLEESLPGMEDEPPLRAAAIERCLVIADRLSRRQVAVIDAATRQALIRDQVMPLFKALGAAMGRLIDHYVPEKLRREFRVRLDEEMRATIAQVAAVRERGTGHSRTDPQIR